MYVKNAAINSALERTKGASRTAAPAAPPATSSRKYEEVWAATPWAGVGLVVPGRDEGVSEQPLFSHFAEFSYRARRGAGRAKPRYYYCSTAENSRNISPGNSRVSMILRNNARIIRPDYARRWLVNSLEQLVLYTRASV